VTMDRAEPENAELLGMIGQVDPPAPGALQDAREVLWSVVADEMLSAGAAGGAETIRARETDRPPQTARPQETDRPRQTVRRRRTDPDS
jgi:hypothetical protein